MLTFFPILKKHIYKEKVLAESIPKLLKIQDWDLKYTDNGVLKSRTFLMCKVMYFASYLPWGQHTLGTKQYSGQDP